MLVNGARPVYCECMIETTHETTAVELVEQRKARMAAILEAPFHRCLSADPDLAEIHTRNDAIRRLREIGASL